MSIFYDQALPKFAAIAQRLLGTEALLSNCFLRDVDGRLTFVAVEKIEEKILTDIRKSAILLAPYVEESNAVSSPEELFDTTLASPDVGVYERIDHLEFKGFVRLVERRIVGQDWLKHPRDPIDNAPPMVVFASHKGGVGRSTALAVAASALSESGNNILVIDLDLEAPGLGEMLLRDLPEFGSLDYFVEDGLADINDEFLDRLVIPSPLTRRGQVHVIPAVGKFASDNPQNVLAKISRAYLEKTLKDGSVETFLDRVRNLVSKVVARNHYDAVFVDARAGLNEATAAAILGLGGNILLFGVDTPQTFAGYRYFLSHLQRFRPPASSDTDWRYRLRMVQAKAQADPKAQANFRTRAFELFSDTLYDLEEGIEEEAFNFDYDDVVAPHYAWPILNDQNYSEFDPLAHEDQFSMHLYDRTFGSFVKALKDSLGL